jgi:putative transposase
MYTYKVVIHPNNKQRTKILNTMNKCIECQNIVFDILNTYIKRKEKLPKCSEIRKLFTTIKKEKDTETINNRVGLTKKEQREKNLDVLFYDVSNDSLKQMVKDTYNAFVRFFKKESKYPNRKTYKDNHKSFYVDPYKIRFTDSKVKLEKIANNKKENRTVLNYVSLAERKRIPTNVKYYNPRVVYDGYRFYIVVSVDDIHAPIKQKKELEDKTIGIDLNISSIVTSENKVYVSINKEKRVKKATRTLKRMQRKASRKYEIAKKEKRKLRECKNFIKNKKAIRRKQERLNNLRSDYINNVINDILTKPPKVIVVEDLDVKQMQQNKKISSLIQITSFGKFITKLKERCNKHNIEVKEANRYYPSSKMCSKCKNIKDKLLLSERVYKCSICNSKINRDLNAAINLANYI